ncbi:MAG TPA: SDR family NAD(P)-dependent oxidoreductase [Bryobacteraceae bacterium]|jgi:acyl transferase domain-containing protein|nr:SDR family NAD(P)-dependent oxidoreductase [Bryobacteraceae bacterium]
MALQANDAERNREFDIAVVGMSGRFPGACSISEFWRNLRDGIESIRFHSREELVQTGLSPELLEHPNLVPASSDLADIDLFDAAFFGYSPAEAVLIDPQQRLFLECAWEALEDAGYNPHTYDGLIGVFAGSGINSYLMRLLERGIVSPTAGLQLTIGNDKDYLTTRVSYNLNLKGPSACVQTACSTSLAAVHLACQSLLGYECDMALAGGVSIRSPQPLAYVWQEGSILSPDGHCRAFDARAAGTIFGNGLGIAVLKRFDDAVASGDHIYAVVRGSAMNNDGAGKVGYTAPSVDGQAAVVRRALAAANVDPSTISYIEAHGTGTSLGDPIEIAALQQVFGNANGFGSRFIGSAKTNLGHLDTAAGIAGFLKATLALAHGVIPPNLHFERPNPAANLEAAGLEVAAEAKPWPRTNAPRRAGVSSFGIGGTNVHAILEEPPPEPQPQPSARRFQLVTLSARSESALEQASLNLAAFLREQPAASLADVAYTLQVGRAAWTNRRALAGSSPPDCADLLQNPPEACSNVARARSVVFAFPGQGSQHPGMGASLDRFEPLYRSIADECGRAFRALIGIDPREITDPEILKQTRYAQPALFLTEYALARQWMEWGIQPAAMIGHSIGELVAACLAEVFSFDDALKLVAARANAMQRCEPGAMLAVRLADEDLPKLPRGISIAALNAPGMAVVSGSFACVDAFAEALSARGIANRRLHTSHAYHSELMEPAVRAVEQAAARIRLSPPRVPFISCVTGDWITPEKATDPRYWSYQLRRTVRFGDGLAAVSQLNDPVLLETGPMQALSKIVRSFRSPRLEIVASLPEPSQKVDDDLAMLRAVGQLWTRGVEIDWTAFHKHETRRRVSLPPYPFERQRFWFDQSAAKPSAASHSVGPYWLPSWKSGPPAQALPPRDLSAPGGWLFLAGPTDLADALIEAARLAGEPVATVTAGERFVQSGDDSFAIAPQDRADIRSLLHTLRGRAAGMPHSIVHLWNLTSKRDAQEDRAGDPHEGRASIFSRGFATLMLLASEAAAIGWKPHLFVVSNHAFRIAGGEFVEPSKLAPLGICRVLPLEQPGFDCRFIDIPSPSERSELGDGLVAALSNELRSRTPETVVAIRPGRRWIQSIDPLPLSLPAQKCQLPESGVYVITGGYGSVGVELAAWLVNHRNARVALIGRNARSEPLPCAEASLLRLQGDVTSPNEVESALSTVENQLGPIDIVLHLAGGPGRGLLETNTPESAQSVLSPKLDGALLLARALQARGGGTLILFSSTFAVAGGIGQADYCAANCCMDAVADFYADSNLRILSVNWDGWQVSHWQDPLADVLPDVAANLKRQRAASGIRVEEAFAAIEAFLAAGLSNAIVSKQDFPALLARERLDATTLLARLGAGRNTPQASSRPTAGKHARPLTATEAAIAAIWSEVLAIPDIGPDDEFLALGGHSLFAIQIAGRIRAELRVELGMREMLECTTVAQLAAIIDGRTDALPAGDLSDLLNEIAAMPEDEVREQIRLATTGS